MLTNVAAHGDPARRTAWPRLSSAELIENALDAGSKAIWR
jgi:hypothetical protein